MAMAPAKDPDTLDQGKGRVNRGADTPDQTNSQPDAELGLGSVNRKPLLDPPTGGTEQRGPARVPAHSTIETSQSNRDALGARAAGGANKAADDHAKFDGPRENDFSASKGEALGGTCPNTRLFSDNLARPVRLDQTRGLPSEPASIQDEGLFGGNCQLPADHHADTADSGELSHRDSDRAARPGLTSRDGLFAERAQQTVASDANGQSVTERRSDDLSRIPEGSAVRADATGLDRAARLTTPERAPKSSTAALDPEERKTDDCSFDLNEKTPPRTPVSSMSAEDRAAAKQAYPRRLGVEYSKLNPSAKPFESLKRDREDQAPTAQPNEESVTAAMTDHRATRPVPVGESMSHLEAAALDGTTATTARLEKAPPMSTTLEQGSGSGTQYPFDADPTRHPLRHAVFRSPEERSCSELDRARRLSGGFDRAAALDDAKQQRARADEAALQRDATEVQERREAQRKRSREVQWRAGTEQVRRLALLRHGEEAQEGAALVMARDEMARHREEIAYMEKLENHEDTTPQLPTDPLPFYWDTTLESFALRYYDLKSEMSLSEAPTASSTSSRSMRSRRTSPTRR